MKILFDQGTPAPLRRLLTGHEVVTLVEKGWSSLGNGDLLRAAEGIFEALITTDQRLRFEQNRSGRRLAILALSTTSWPRIRMHAALVVSAVDSLKPGELVDLQIPDDSKGPASPAPRRA